MKKRTPIHPRKKQKILERDNFKCCDCNVAGDFNALEVDHIISVKDGGSDEDSNLQALCYRCNMKKYWGKDITDKYFLNLTPKQRLELVKDRLNDYKNLTWAEFKVIYTQDELFQRLRLNLVYLQDLFTEISGKKRITGQRDNKYFTQRNRLIYILRQEDNMTCENLSILLKKHGFDVSKSQISRICNKFGDIIDKKDSNGEKEVKSDKKDIK